MVESEPASEPPRPAGVPDDARWVPEKSVFRAAAAHRDGKPHGAARQYRADGTLACVCAYVDGVAFGPYERFHPDGTWAERGQVVAGKAHGTLTWRRSASPSPEVGVPAACAPNVARAEATFEHGVQWPARYFDADDGELLSTGEPVPPRPDGVDRAACFDPRDRRWFLGLGQALTDRHGPWQWWTEDGARLLDKRYHRGAEIEELTYDPPAVVRTRRVHGHRQSVLLEQRFDAAGRAVDAQGVPVPDERPAGVPTDAVFNVADDGWLQGAAPSDKGVCGRYMSWTRAGVPEREQMFEDGARIAERRFSDEGALTWESRYDAANREVSDLRFYADGELRARTERAYGDEGLLAMRIWVRGAERTVARREGPHVRYTFRDRDGQLLAEGCLDEDDDTVGVWTFVEGGEVHRLDLTEASLHARVGEGYDPLWLLGRALLPRASDGPRPEALAGVDDVDWASLDGAFCDDVAAFPALLHALTSPVAAVRRTALADILAEVEHQGSIYAATAAVVPFLIALLGDPRADRSELLGIVAMLTELAGGGADADEPDEPEDDDDVASDVLRAVQAGFERIAACLPTDGAVVVSIARRVGRAGRGLLLAAADGVDPDLVPIAVHGLVSCAELPTDAAGWLRHPDPLVRLVAAIAAAERFGSRAPPAAVEVLAAAIAADLELQARFHDLPFTRGHVLAYVALRLAEIGTPQARIHAVDLAARLDGLDLFTLDSVSLGLLALCFGDGEPPYAPGFVDVLRRMGACRGLVGFGNFAGSARRWNLPGDPAKLRVLADAIAALPDPAAGMREAMLGAASP